MTRLPLSGFLRNTGLYRRQWPLRAGLIHNSRRFLSEASSHTRSPRDEQAVSNNVVENPIPALPQSSKLQGDAALDASEPTTLPVEKPLKRTRKPKNKSASGDGDTSTEGQPSEKQKPKKSRKKSDKPFGRPTTLQIGEVLPEVPAGELPPIHLWRKYFPAEKISSRRPTVRNPKTAAILADIFVPEGSKNKIIIEASPGPGQLTRALLRLPKERIKKIYVLEQGKSYLKYLQPLEQLDPRVKVYAQNGMGWETYTKLKNDGAFDEVARADWDEVHPQLQFIMHMNAWIDGEQLLSQFLRCIPDRQWLFQYGRVPLNLILPTRMWERVNASEGETARCKLSVIAQATADLKECVHQAALKPYADHFHPERVSEFTLTRGNLEPRKTGTNQMAVRVLPLKHQLIARGDLDIWDFILRKLFVLKATSVKTCLNSNVLGPGSNNLIPKLTDPTSTFDPATKGPRDLSIPEWSTVFEVFKKWPFRPEDLGIETFFEVKAHNR